jgi:hypothetical protein
MAQAPNSVDEIVKREEVASLIPTTFQPDSSLRNRSLFMSLLGISRTRGSPRQFTHKSRRRSEESAACMTDLAAAGRT